MAENEETYDLTAQDFENIDREVKEHVTRVYGNYSSFMAAVAADVNEASAILKSSDSQFARRTYLRAFFAFVEGVLFAKRVVLREFLKGDEQLGAPRRLSDAEIMLLEDVQYDLDDDGTPKVRDRNFQPFLRYVRFTFHISAKFFRRANKVNYGDTGWESFRKAYEVRNRIMHPKAIADLDISDSELQNVRVGASWFVAAIGLV